MMNNKKSLVTSFIFAFILPVIAYGILKLLAVSDTLALGVATAFPVLLTLYTAFKKKKINPIGLVAVCGFLISIVAVYLSHGNDLAFKLWHPILTGAIGIILLFSAAINHPLMGLLAKKQMAKSVSVDKAQSKTVETVAQGQIDAQEDDEEELDAEDLAELHRFFMIYTLFMGFVFALHAILTIMLAFAVDTTQFVFVSKGIDILAIVILVAGIFLINRRLSDDEDDEISENEVKN
ncbi:hypothetical protein [Lactococcus sp.]|uniref:hypothetical protein n=1 Tax=Lactococcus sp. TaxID=44273 RepID=UPI0035B14E2B